MTAFLLVTGCCLLVTNAVLLLRPEPQFPETMPMCHECGRKFRAIRGLLHHVQAEHPCVWDGETPKEGPYR